MLLLEITKLIQQIKTLLKLQEPKASPLERLGGATL